MEIQKEKRSNVMIITLGATKTGDHVSGEIELDVDNNYILTEAVEEQLALNNINVVLDLKNVNYVDSSGLGAIFDSYKQVVEKKGVLRILSPKIDVKRVLDITKISKKINIYVNLDEAIQSFNS